MASRILPFDERYWEVWYQRDYNSLSLFDSGMIAVMSDKVRNSIIRAMEFSIRPGKPEKFARTVHEELENAMLHGEVIQSNGEVRMSSKM